MLKEIVALWKGETFMGKIVEGFGEMLSDAEYVFTNAWGALTGQLDIEQVKQPLHDKDRAVNGHEREIRRKLLEHLSINPRQDISGCLVIMSLVKDAERIGDYSKNIFDLGVILHRSIKDMKYLTQLSAVQKKIAGIYYKLSQLFGLTWPASADLV